MSTSIGCEAAATAESWRETFTPALVLALAAALISFDVTALAVALPAIGAEFGFGMAGFAWVMDAYSLAFAGLLLAAGAVADRHGRRRVLLWGNLLFAAASLGCGLAWTGPALWAARAIQGVGAAMVITGALALISDRYREPRLRARAFALVGIVSGAAMALGPTAGGLVAEVAGWRWIFLVNLPFCVWLGRVVPRLLPEATELDGRPLDPLGVLLLTLALGAAIAGMLQGGGGTLPWWAWPAGAAILLAGFVLQQRGRPRPLLDPAVFARPETLGICAVLLAMSVGYWALLVYLPLFLQAAQGLTTGQAGLAMLAATLPMLALPPLGARLAPRLGWPRFFGLGLLGVAGGNLLLALGAQPWTVLAGMLLCGCGAGLVNAQISGAMIATVPSAQGGMASAIATVMRQGGFAIGIALLGATVETGQGAAGFAPGFLVAAACAGGVGLACLWAGRGA
ncbi:putative MFS family arabinose efflux permease [Stella humosa]|uniref:Putative MFS family arabinose efflux permease n=1 Tax=Stella humosa TaxID=94 RepID=A0A3N1M7K8_9PROT|nr:MFS transporter [Stella humosa]ROQ01812.1 putative MFS family arabinose efflux permease [Stella humosa]BBK32199.1 MFS transporter [Stella humosa]